MFVPVFVYASRVTRRPFSWKNKLRGACGRGEVRWFEAVRSPLSVVRPSCVRLVRFNRYESTRIDSPHSHAPTCSIRKGVRVGVRVGVRAVGCCTAQSTETSTRRTRAGGRNPRRCSSSSPDASCRRETSTLRAAARVERVRAETSRDMRPGTSHDAHRLRPPHRTLQCSPGSSVLSAALVRD